MSTSAYDSLVSALSSLDVPCERTTPATFGETLAGHLRDPAVGVPLEGVDALLERPTKHPIQLLADT